MESDINLSKICKESHKNVDKREKLLNRLEKLRLKNLEHLKKFKNDLKLEIAELLRIWLEASKTCKKSRISISF